MGGYFEIATVLTLLVVAYACGSALEVRHYRRIRAREERWRRLPALTFRRVPEGWRATESALVSGSVVISIDYFKRFLAGLRGLVHLIQSPLQRRLGLCEFGEP